MPSRQQLRSIGLEQGDRVVRALAAEIRTLRMAANLSQAQVASAAGVSRTYLCRLELGHVRSIDIRVACLIFVALGQRLSVKGFPIGEPMRDAGQLRLLDRFDARVPPVWRRTRESPMPIRGDLRAWDERLDGPVSIGVDAETRPNDLQAIERSMELKKRQRRRAYGPAHSSHGPEREAHPAPAPNAPPDVPLDTRTFLAAIAAGRDPGGDALVVL